MTEIQSSTGLTNAFKSSLKRTENKLDDRDYDSDYSNSLMLTGKFLHNFDKEISKLNSTYLKN